MVSNKNQKTYKLNSSHVSTMFDEVRECLETIDHVLNAKVYDQAVAFDKGEGFDPDAEEVDDNLRDSIWLSSIPLYKKTGEKTKYILLELRLEDGEREYSQNYLRGFERAVGSHPSLAELFLREVRSQVGDNLELPRMWPWINRAIDNNWERSVTAENDGLKLTITVVGGAIYDLKDGCINLMGYSMAFGAVPYDYQDKLTQMLGILVQKNVYDGFEINQEV